MSVEETNLVRTLSGKMRWLAERQRVLAQNVANADTPGFRPKDLSAFNFKNDLAAALTTPKATHANHIVGKNGVKAGFNIVNGSGYETLPSGNAVNLESEMMKVSQTGMDYQQMTALLKRWHGMIRTALGK